jgi:16S rRNA (cytidine1402-2'-O)-methyltransferase
MLYLIATPIGNLSDFSFRALEVCQKCDYLLCEDTRRSSILLNHYQIKKPLKSYHQFNESEKLSFVLQDLSQGLEIGLLSDGGTPALCDPGEILVKACREKKIPITSIPGPCALIQALILSGFTTHPFQFFGFLPRKDSEILQILPFALSFAGTSIFYESPQRLTSTLELIAQIAPDLEVAVVRELTKTFEEVIRLPAKEAHLHFVQNPPRGEIVLLFQGLQENFQDKSPKDLVEELMNIYKISLTEAIKTAAHLLKTNKQTVYKLFHSEK